jgi:hypothetical protein
MMETLYFLARFAPFWSIPGMMISGEFAYIFWMRKKKKLVVFCGSFAFFCGSVSVMYFIAGGPEKSVKKLIDFIWFFRH